MNTLQVDPEVRMSVCACACVRACVRACVHVCVCACDCLHACVRNCMCEGPYHEVVGGEGCCTGLHWAMLDMDLVIVTPILETLLRVVAMYAA